MVQNVIGSLLDADLRHDGRLVPQLAVGDNEAIIFHHSLAQTMPPLVVVHINLRPRRHEKDLVMITPKGREQLARRSSCSILERHCGVHQAAVEEDPPGFVLHSGFTGSRKANSPRCKCGQIDPRQRSTIAAQLFFHNSLPRFGDDREASTSKFRD